MAGVVIVAHAPLASSLLSCATHVFGTVSDVVAYDVGADDDPGKTLDAVRNRIAAVDRGEGVLVLTDVVGATPSNQADKAAHLANDAGIPTSVVAGTNLPMLLRALTNRHLPLDETVQRVLDGGAHAILEMEAPPTRFARPLGGDARGPEGKPTPARPAAAPPQGGGSSGPAKPDPRRPE
ncbi:PTS sugar transporter subunit IIA [Pigmentiphaga soli]